jgi:hypothetical protein
MKRQGHSDTSHFNDAMAGIRRSKLTRLLQSVLITARAACPNLVAPCDVNKLQWKGRQ